MKEINLFEPIILTEKDIPLENMTIKEISAFSENNILIKKEYSDDEIWDAFTREDESYLYFYKESILDLSCIIYFSFFKKKYKDILQSDEFLLTCPKSIINNCREIITNWYVQNNEEYPETLIDKGFKCLGIL